MKYFIITYGCQMNISDSERIAFALEKDLKMKPAKNLQEADLVVVNMCSVRQPAVDRVLGLKEKLKGKKVVLTGCILKKDWQMLEKSFEIKQFDAPNHRTKKFGKKTIVHIPIMTGCDNFCSYCVVPYTRGRERSRPQKEIICEIKNRLKNGAKEFWLLGQNVNSYSYGFSKLLRAVNKIPGKFWIRFTSSHPKDFSDDIIKAMKECKKVTPYLNLPAQSGDDEILKKMNRPYKINDYIKIIKKVRKEIPDICLSADLIVGFPGETEKHFNNTKKLFEKVKYDMAYINKYSPRSGTAASKMENNISIEEKKEREKILNNILRKNALENNQKFVGKTEEVLPTEFKSGFLFGKSYHYKTVKFKGSKKLVGNFCEVKITKALPWGLKGEYARPVASKASFSGLNKLVVIVGPTASGKTGLSIKLAKKFRGEVVSADSRQIYKGMDIGTGKVTKKEMQNIPHHLLDVASPKKRFTVTQYKKLAEKAIKNIQKRNELPIIVGGTGFYIRAVIDGIVIPEVKPDWKLRKKLEKESAEKLFKQLKKLDPERAKNIDKFNKRRLIRALEIVLKTKNPIPPLKTNPIDSDVFVLGLAKDRKELAKLIRVRLIKRLKQGMIAEVKRLHQQGVSWKRLKEFGLEYKYIALLLQEKISKEEMIEKLQKEIEHYAKRQMTWFKRDHAPQGCMASSRIHWVKTEKQAQKLLTKFLR